MLEGIPLAAGHSQEAADITVSDVGHKTLIQTARVVAAVNLCLLLDEEVRQRAKAEHAMWKEKYNQQPIRNPTPDGVTISLLSAGMESGS